MQHVKDNIEAQYWQAFMERDSSANGTFFVAVRSTGIYCKPSCPSKRPKRENVMFFTSPEAAEQAGFFACKRCPPREGGEGDPHGGLLQRGCRHIEGAI